jgi:hypothetical protein
MLRHVVTSGCALARDVSHGFGVVVASIRGHRAEIAKRNAAPVGSAGTEVIARSEAVAKRAESGGLLLGDPALASKIEAL